MTAAYCVCGVTVNSEVEIPGWIACPPPAGPPDVSVRRGDVPEHLTEPTFRGVLAEFDDREFLLRIPNIARFLIVGGRKIVFQPEQEGADEAAIAFVAGTAFGILLHRRGRIVMHASAVRVGDKAVLFCGPSGAGKSTMAAALGTEGYPLLTDDFCALEFTGEEVLVHPDGRQLKLWEQTIHRLNLSERRGSKIRNELHKYFVQPVMAHSDPIPLGAIYVLIALDSRHKFGIAAVELANAPLVLQRNAYRPLLVKQLNQRQDYFRAAVAVISAGGLYRFVRPLDFSAMPRVVAALREHWSGLPCLN